MSRKHNSTWEEAQRRCGLSNDEIRMAKELGFQPHSLIKNIPSPSQRWKAPVKQWVRGLYEDKFGSRAPAAAASQTRATPNRVIEFRNPEYPWPDRPEVPELVMEDPFDATDNDQEDVDAFWGADPFQDRFEPPSDEDEEEQNTLMLRRQCLFRWAAQWVAVAMSKLPEVRKVAAFGAVAQPLEKEVPRFREFRRHRIEVFHECADLDLAVWLSDLSRLKQLKNAMSNGLSLVQDTPYGGVAHHQVDVHIFDAESAYRGRLCIFGRCPKPGKRECRVPGCGDELFLQQFQGYRFNPPRFEGELRVILFDRATGFVVRPPRMDAKPPRFVRRSREDDAAPDDDVPF